MKYFAVVFLILFAACTGSQAPSDTASQTPRDTAPASPQTSPPPIPDATIVVDEAPTPAPSTTQPSTPQNPPQPGGNVTIQQVEVGNPLTISGTARTFENNVALRARAADGTLIVEGFTTANGDMGQFNPYRGSLWLTRDPGPRIIVEALEYSARDGSEQSLVRVERPFAVQPVEARLYFPDANCIGVKPYTRRIPKTVSMARVLVEALLAGPVGAEKTRGATSPFPRESRVESVNLRDGTLTVDFNERLRNVGGSCAAQMIRASVTETLRQLPAVRKVVITAGGSEALALQP